MEQLRAELSHLLGEKLSRIECVNEKVDTALWSLYDSRKSDAADGEKFHHAGYGAATGMENLHVGAQWYGAYARHLRGLDPRRASRSRCATA